MPGGSKAGGGLKTKQSPFYLRSGNRPSPLHFLRGAATDIAAQEQYDYKPESSPEGHDYLQPDFKSTAGDVDYDLENRGRAPSTGELFTSRWRSKDWARQDRIDDQKDARQAQIDAAMRNNPNLISDLQKKWGSLKKHSIGQHLGGLTPTALSDKVKQGYTGKNITGFFGMGGMGGGFGNLAALQGLGLTKVGGGGQTHVKMPVLPYSGQTNVKMPVLPYDNRIRTFPTLS